MIFTHMVIGVLFGMEESFPAALVERIRQMGVKDIEAEAVQIGAVRLDEPARYRLIIDRISQDIPFYRGYLKNAALAGTEIINNPFWWTADDKFFNYALAERLGVAVPPTVLLPHKHHPPGTTDRSMRNLRFPLDWDAVFEYIGFPAFLKPYTGGGWKDVYKVNSPQELFAAYDQTGTLCMTLQRGVNFNEYFRCYVIGREKVHIMPYEPRAPFHERYLKNPPAYDPALLARVERDALTLCRALGYDFNTVEFAVENGIPYAIDFMNPAPDAERTSIGDANFTWIVETAAEFAVRRALSPARPPAMTWDQFLRTP